MAQERTVFSLSDLGWSSFFEQQYQKLATPGLKPARVAEENRGLYRILSPSGELWASVRGALRRSATTREALPAVGDWVLVQHDPPQATIHSLFQRRTKFARKMAGNRTEQQIVAANIDTLFLVTSLNRDFNLRRLERYLALAWESGAQPVVILNKTDLCDNSDEYLAPTKSIVGTTQIILCSALTGSGRPELRERVRIGGTTALLGSSGVGKSSLINAIVGDKLQLTAAVRPDDDRGRHTTTARQLILVPGGGILIDTPGMREVQLWDASDGLDAAFSDIERLARSCKFRDCRHASEPGCAVRQAIAADQFAEDRLDSFHKLEREQLFLESKRNAALRSARNHAFRKIAKAQNRGYRDH
jgi:ribosome biogenesis GTPase